MPCYTLHLELQKIKKTHPCLPYHNVSLPRPRSKLFTVLYNMGHDGYNHDLWSVALPHTVSMAAHSGDVTCIYIIYLSYLSING